MLPDKIPEQALKGSNVKTGAVGDQLTRSVVHPHGRSLRCKKKGLSSENILNLLRDEVHNLVAGRRYFCFISTFSVAVKPDNQRNLFTCFCFRLVIAVAKIDFLVLVFIKLKEIPEKLRISAILIENVPILLRNGVLSLNRNVVFAIEANRRSETVPGVAVHA